MKRYERLTKDPVAREEALLAEWRAGQTFERSLEQTKDGPRYVFYEGPPTANGMPHFGHLMPRVYKDLFPRYKTMQGHYVLRKGGWDTHGLPVELEVEKEIGVNSKAEIEAYGVERFVEKCKESVWRYKGEWERMIERMAFWIDLDAAYVTYADEYIESVWWELKTMFDRGLLYQGHKTLPYCPRCGTGLSSHEVAQGYKSVEDPSVSIRMRISNDEESCYKRDGDDPVSLLTWTTTPWTLPANVALAVAEDAVYAEVKQNDERFILAKALVEKALEGEARVVREFPGSDLVGLRYEPAYLLTVDPAAHRVYPADFVNLEDGTGIVHIASAFGEDDYRLGQEVGLPFVQPVDLEGNFTEAFPMCAGVFVKDADPKIVEDLAERGLLYRSVIYEHDYPFCWRCDTPLLYYAMDSWYVQTTAVKDQMIESNAKIQWIPAHVGEGRLADFLTNLKDWALSRDRYWGTPLNLWVCRSCGEVSSVGSRAELIERAIDPSLAESVELHRPYIDDVILRCIGCGQEAHRVPYVIDAWFDAGSMHTAQWHYPFENEETFRDQFPADFICEAMEQTRGWFYTLLATSTIVHGVAPYRTCLSTGLGLDEQGLKMSKSKGNALDPWKLIDRYGADCIRWFLFSTTTPWKTRRFSEKAIAEPLYRFLDRLRNTYDFFALYASIDGYDPESHAASETGTTLDRWIRSRLHSTTKTVVGALDGYDVVTATATLEGLVDDLSNWYVRLSRRRFWKGGMGPDKISAYGTLREVLLETCKLLAPFVPYLADEIYMRLRAQGDPESVHLCRFPAADPGAVDEDLETEMALARRIAALGHQARNQSQIRVRQPLSGARVKSSGTISRDVAGLIETELNVERIEVTASLDAAYEETPAPNFRTLGPRLGPDGQAAGVWIRSQSAGGLRERLTSGSTSVDLEGRSIVLNAEDVVYESVLQDGYTLTEEAGVELLLDCRIDDELQAKGLLREVVHRIQLARKAAGFEVTDRIILSYEGDEALERAISENETEVASEVLAKEIVSKHSADAEYSEKVELDEGSITIGLRRAGA
ncbi:MAG: isoleucine--tRNA ligase [Candidatus Bipolaricaulia bacterium]